MFTNFYLKPQLTEYAVKTLSYISGQTLIWDEYQKPNFTANIDRSPIHFILSQDALRYGWYTLLIFLLLFALFESKRRQRLIPVIEPPRNTTREYIETIGQLYLSHNNNADLAHKKIVSFYDYIQTTWYLKPEPENADFRKHFSKKTGLPLDATNELFDNIMEVNIKKELSNYELIELIRKINDVRYPKDEAVKT